ncbi:hypothetical protein ACUNHQ_10695 [Serratia sp. IR-2025]
MSETIFNIKNIRDAIVSSLPQNDQAGDEPAQDPQFTYVPPSHARALNPENVIVEGMRGAGKSHWWAALNSKDHRNFLAKAFPEARIEENLIITQGFGVTQSPNYWPSKDTIRALIEKHEPRHIWRAIVAVHTKFPRPFPLDSIKWSERVDWVAKNSEDYEQLLYAKDAELYQSGRMHLILFDALDRLADDWGQIRPLARSLFQLALDLRSCKSIRFKIFVRPDMLDDRDILSFPDSSKLVARKVTLNWQRADLYALFFQCLGNDETHGNEIRNVCKDNFGIAWKREPDTKVWLLPEALKNNDEIQKSIFHAIAGPAMAGGVHGHKRGYPYTWLPNHLIDGKDQVSPRSFSSALRYAAQGTPVDKWLYPLHFKEIQRGVQEASRIRVWEMTNEDYPWVEHVMKPLEKLTVPCSESDIFTRWEDDGALDKLEELIKNAHTEVKLLPPTLHEGAKGVLTDLEDLGIITHLWDSRIQMPDVYRISFKLGRRGGVKPLK